MEKPSRRPDPALPREHTPVDDPMPGLGSTIPERTPPEDEALGVDAPPERQARPTDQPARGTPPAPARTSPGEPMPGLGKVIPEREPPEDEALGVPVDEEPAPRQ